MNDSGIVAARPRFDALFDEAVPRVLGATHVIDVPPRPGGGRWPVSVALMPNEVEGRRFTELMTQLLPFSGPGHFLTGHPAALHVTVRALEDRRNDIQPDDPAVGRYRSAVFRTASRNRAVCLRVVGLTLTTTGVMVALEPEDEAAASLARILAEELGPDGWREAEFARAIWYAMILHFAAPVAQPDKLVAFVADRRRLDLGTVTLNSLSVVRFNYTAEADGSRYLQPQELETAPLSAG